MGGQVDAEQDGEEQTDAGGGKKRDRTLIEFPYTDLQRSHELTRALSEAGGKVWIEQTQLAVALDMSAAGGTFRSRLSAARMFGFVETEGGKVRLSDLGIYLLDESTERAAKADAFLRVPLYKAMYDAYNGFALPPAAAIERQMSSLGVPPKQTERARQAFASSAQSAGFIASNGRFSKPTISPVPAREEATEREHGGGGGGNGNGNVGSGSNGGWAPAPPVGNPPGGGIQPGTYHPLIEGLLITLPKIGQPWSQADRKAWLTTAESIFSLIYTKSSEARPPEDNDFDGLLK